MLGWSLELGALHTELSHLPRSSSSLAAGMHCQAAVILLRSLVCRGTGMLGAMNECLCI